MKRQVIAMTDYEDTFHPNGTDGDDVQEIPSINGWFGDDDSAARTDKSGMKNLIWITVAGVTAIGAYILYSGQEFDDVKATVKVEE